MVEETNLLVIYFFNLDSLVMIASAVDSFHKEVKNETNLELPANCYVTV